MVAEEKKEEEEALPVPVVLDQQKPEETKQALPP